MRIGFARAPLNVCYVYYLIHISLIYTYNIFYTHLSYTFFSIIFKNTCVYFCFSTFIVTLFPLSYQCQSNLINISNKLTCPKLDLPYYHLVRFFPTLKRRRDRNETPMIQAHPAPLPLIPISHSYVV